MKLVPFQKYLYAKLKIICKSIRGVYQESYYSSPSILISDAGLKVMTASFKSVTV